MLILLLWLLAALSFGLGAFKVKARVDWLLLGLMFIALTQVLPAVL